MMEFVKRAIAEHFLAIVASALSYLLARWLLDLSTPEKDWEKLRRWWPGWPELRWYRGPEYFHQLRGTRLLESMV